MNTSRLPLLALLVSLPLVACRSTGEGCCPQGGDPAVAVTLGASGFEYAVLSFGSLDAGLAANAARRDFAVPPMEREVQVFVDPAANAWIVSATPRDLERVREIAAQMDREASAKKPAAATEPSFKDVTQWLARRNAEVIHFEHQDAALAANSARKHLDSPDLAEPVIVLVDRGVNAWIALADRRGREHVRNIAAQYDREDGPLPRTR